MKKTIALFVMALAVLAAAQTGAAQQAEKVYRIGLLSFQSPDRTDRTGYFSAFGQGLRELGYVEGKNIVIERRYAFGNRDRLAELAAELVRLNVDVIVGGGSAMRAAIKATRTIPIVVAVAGDYVARGCPGRC